MKVSSSSNDRPVTDLVLQYGCESARFENHGQPMIAPYSSYAVIAFEDSVEVDYLIQMLTEFKKHIQDSYQFTSTVNSVKGGRYACSDAIQIEVDTSRIKEDILNEEN